MFLHHIHSCTSADNISETEATESLPDIAVECAELWTKITELGKKSKSLREQVGTLEDEKAAVEELQDQLETKYVSQRHSFSHPARTTHPSSEC